jgi:hypothetical protein
VTPPNSALVRECLSPRHNEPRGPGITLSSRSALPRNASLEIITRAIPIRHEGDARKRRGVVSQMPDPGPAVGPGPGDRPDGYIPVIGRNSSTSIDGSPGAWK